MGLVLGTPWEAVNFNKAAYLDETVPSLQMSWTMTPIQVRTSRSMFSGLTFLLNEASAQQTLKRDKAIET